MKPDYSHTYQTCAHSMKRKNAPWQVDGGCGSPVRVFTGTRYELPYHTACFTCSFYCKDKSILEEGVES